ncbi:pyridoxamine 5'-phosphate oxidase family protein [Haloechinothrix sp. LS1_15]|uniref:pyridoxamine 5'-phosphate oxidase family protein n=1 Tax=Haloechinothrix sp. LS1_15 TaxID=2652248 RepID=UPI0029450E6C|nr:pyridoxamine 5'-phosphate oxidase family protein [Haloechinothrix sp. LS1_15]MDV6013485.1 pyridoxamine 5'-phosphate oxidase family protein [Haloechinothrix sp. LS1_15]
MPDSAFLPPASSPGLPPHQPALSSTERSTPSRTRHRTVHRTAALHEVLDAGFLCHVATVRHGAPVTLPTCYGRDGNTLYLHGSSGAHHLRAVSGGQLCVAVTHVDGIVYARSLVHHSLNYRSAVIHGTAHAVDGQEEKLHGLRVITDHLAPGSWQYAREISRKELASVAVVAVPLAEAAVKIRDDGPNDEPDDVADGSRWAGVLPLWWGFGEPRPSEDLAAPVALPDHVAAREATAHGVTGRTVREPYR